MNLSGYVGHVTIFNWMLTTACCLVVGLGLGLFAPSVILSVFEYCRMMAQHYCRSPVRSIDQHYNRVRRICTRGTSDVVLSAIVTAAMLEVYYVVAAEHRELCAGTWKQLCVEWCANNLCIRILRFRILAQSRWMYLQHHVDHCTSFIVNSVDGRDAHTGWR